MVTFVTLGYGDISQDKPWLQIYSSIQAFSGMVLMGLFLAGFASKSKAY
ncbi:ion channel [Vibrio parahaemolyticus]